MCGIPHVGSLQSDRTVTGGAHLLIRFRPWIYVATYLRFYFNTFLSVVFFDKDRRQSPPFFPSAAKAKETFCSEYTVYLIS